MTQSDERSFVLASSNKHKVHEVTRILASLGAERKIISMYDACIGAGVAVPETVEDGDTFAANALIKARAIAKVTGLPTLADDSGISVDALNGMPGIFSARWAGGHGDDGANLSLLLAQLTDVPDRRRGAAFVCAVAYVDPDAPVAAGSETSEVVAQGEVRGSLIHAPRGDNGFGYDPIFVPDGFDVTTAEMSGEQKDELSHRRRALEQLVGEL